MSERCREVCRKLGRSRFRQCRTAWTRIRVRGGKPLVGNVRISGAKNAALPILCATLLSDGASRLRNVPALRDIDTTAALLRFLGRDVQVDAPEVARRRGQRRPPRGAVRARRSRCARACSCSARSLARFGRAKVSLPGGCAIGARPIDQHLKGLEAMGAKIRLERGYVIAEGPAAADACAAPRSCFDMPTVTGTENLMMAAALAKGRTTLVNCAREPEVEELGSRPQQDGRRGRRRRHRRHPHRGRERGELAPFDHAIIPDRIEAGTYMVAAAMPTGGDVILEGAELHGPRGARREDAPGGRRDRDAKAQNDPRAPHRTAPRGERDDRAAPGFPDRHAGAVPGARCASRAARASSPRRSSRTASCTCPSSSAWAPSIALRGNTAVVQGVEQLYGASVMATDLRASASLVIAGLVAEGETEVRRVYHLDRGYERIEEKLGGARRDASSASKAPSAERVSEPLVVALPKGARAQGARRRSSRARASTRARSSRDDRSLVRESPAAGCASCCSSPTTCRRTSSTAPPTSACAVATCCSSATADLLGRSISGSVGADGRRRRRRHVAETPNAASRASRRSTRASRPSTSRARRAGGGHLRAGSVELAPLVGLADCIVDLVETGETLATERARGRRRGRRRLDVLVVNRAACKLRRGEISAFVERLRAALHGAPPSPAG